MKKKAEPAWFVKAAASLPPCSLTLDGMEAMDLVAIIIRAKAGGDNQAVINFFKLLAQAVAISTTKEDGVDMVIEEGVKNGVTFPRYMAPLIKHCLSVFKEKATS